MLSGAEVLPLPAARLKRQTRTADGAKLRSYCIAGPKSSTASIPAGQTSSWTCHPRRGGCSSWTQMDAHTGTRKIQWTLGGAISKQATGEAHPLASQGGVAAATLRKDHFVADWGGFFVPDPNEPDHYTGRLLHDG